MTLDFEPEFRPDILHDITAWAPPFEFDAAYSLDVIEHIPPDKEKAFMANVAEMLWTSGVFIVGTPNKTSLPYAAADTVTGHVNAKTGGELRALMLRYYRHCFMFGMNDETLHTGFSPMCHYLLALGVEPR